MRSKLFVPGSRPELFAKALASQADAISIDLEDSVVEARKAEARSIVRDFLQSAEVRTTSKIIIVRVNAIGTSHFEEDIAAVVLPTLTMLNLPKPESATDILEAAALLLRAEITNGLESPVKILANIETPKALRKAAEIASAHPRVVGLQLGLGDLFEAIGVDRRETINVHAAMFAMRMAAGEANVFAYDGAFANVPDLQSYRAEAEMAHRLGYLGKSCIHPSQISLANDVFKPTDEEINHAKRVLDAARKAQTDGIGAIMVDGRMVDIPFIRRAEAIIATAKLLDRNTQ